MINKIFFMIIILVGGFAFLITLGGYQMIKLDSNMSNDPCGFKQQYDHVADYNATTGLSSDSYVTTDTTQNKSIPGMTNLISTGGTIYCYVTNSGAYANSLSKAFGLPEIVIQILNIIFVIFFLFGIFWLVYYIGSIFAWIFR